MLRISILLAPVLALGFGACHSDDDGGTSLTRNLGLATEHFEGHGALWALVVREAFQGTEDLNGDGDAFDRILHIYHDGDAAPTNLELALSTIIGTSLPVLAVGEVLVAFGVDEVDQAFSDLNGDGDSFDRVLHVYDDTDGSVTNTGLQMTTTQPAIGAGLVAFLVPEETADLNGDGDTDDDVLHVYDAATRVTTNAQRAVTSRLAFHDHAFAFTTDEASAAADLNGDGDQTDDKVFELYDRTTGGIIPVPIAILAEPLVVGVDEWFVLADEAQESADLNADGDLVDGVFQRIDPHLGTILPLGLSSLETFRSSTDGLELALVAQEIDDLDRNGDGDLDDDVVVLYDASNDQAIDTGLAIDIGLGPILVPMFLGDQLVVAVNEQAQGLDLNADGDDLDLVVHLVERASGVARNLGLGVSSGGRTAAAALFQRSEASEGQDFDADGDQDDFVTFLLRPGSTALENTGAPGVFVSGTEDAENVLLVAEESGRDMNGDGDGADFVYLLHEVATGTQRNLALATDNAFAALNSSGGGLLLVSESSQGRDLNGDGLVGGDVAFALQIR